MRVPFQGESIMEEEELLLIYLHNMGVIDEVRAMTIRDMAKRLEMDPNVVAKAVESNLKKGYLRTSTKGPEPRYYISPEAVLKVSRFHT